MEHVIKAIDPETKEEAWFKDGSPRFFEVTGDRSQAKRFDSSVEAEGIVLELRKSNPLLLFYVTAIDDECITEDSDAVKHLRHYQDPSGVECIDIVRHRNFDIGNAIWCLEKQIEDLRKAIWDIQEEITTLKSKKSKECS